MKLSEKFFEQTNQLFTRNYDPEWKELDHFKTRPTNWVSYKGTTDKYKQFSAELTRKDYCQIIFVYVNFDKYTGEYVGIETSVKRNLREDELSELVELITSYFIRMAKHGYLINQFG